ncbi:VENN motif pre-toxin domain-containing protein [Proteus alimentorum]|uniref:VENN motif pre-toxin domain-containing protein n=1 Tax=Proteus alimentorum TaxID=1973495 RepID=UPI000BFFD445|nr:VENN motif pre-toxin domain-containing protein [Proteus alimentorum]
MMGNNIVTAIANGSAPYLANEVKNQIQGSSVESDIQRTLAHGLVNAGLALAKGENAATQAAGAMTGETVGILSHSFYGKTPEELTETEKQNISAWATLASGIAGGLISDNSAGVANAAQAGKVVVENNLLGGNELTHTQLAQEYGKDRMSCAENPNSESCKRGKALQQAYIYALATGSTGSVSLLSTSARVMWFIGAGANSSVQYIDSKKVNPVNAIIAGWVNVMTMGEGWKSTVFFNAAGGALTNTINDESAVMGAITTGGGALMGYGLGNFMVKPVTNWIGKIITKGNNPGFNEGLRKSLESEVKGNSYIMKEVSESKIPSGMGNTGGSIISELGGLFIQEKINESKEY